MQRKHDLGRAGEAKPRWSPSGPKKRRRLRKGSIADAGPSDYALAKRILAVPNDDAAFLDRRGSPHDPTIYDHRMHHAFHHGPHDAAFDHRAHYDGADHRPNHRPRDDVANDRTAVHDSALHDRLHHMALNDAPLDDRLHDMALDHPTFDDGTLDLALHDPASNPRCFVLLVVDVDAAMNARAVESVIIVIQRISTTDLRDGRCGRG
jgi:hypothetical protein